MTGWRLGAWLVTLTVLFLVYLTLGYVAWGILKG